jgi:hypothetical protein
MSHFEIAKLERATTVQRHTPENIDHHNYQRPIPDGGHIRQIVGCIGKKSGQCTQKGGLYPGTIVHCRSNCKEEDAGNIHQIKNDSRCPIYLGA